MRDAQAHRVLALPGQTIQLPDTQRSQTEMKDIQVPSTEGIIFSMKFRRTAFPDIMESECNL